MNRFGTRICILASLLLFIFSSVNAQSFEDEEMGNWYPNQEEGNYDTTAEITDERASHGSYSVRVTVGSDLTNGAFANDNQSVSASDTLTFRVWVDQSNLDLIAGIQPFAQDDSWSYDTPGYVDITADEWNEVSLVIPDEWSGTNRIGLQVNGDSASYTPTVYVDQITRNGTVLPVELTSFNAVQNGNNVALQWSTASETNNAGFEIQQRREGSSWNQVGFVVGHETTNQHQNYTYNLQDLSAGLYTFRLRQVDLDGTAEYSSEVTVQVSPNRALDLSSATPNPFQEQTRFTLSVSERQDVRVDVFNTLGQRVAVLHDGPVATGSVQSLTLESSDLSSGVYFVRGQSESHSVTRRIEIVR